MNYEELIAKFEELGITPSIFDRSYRRTEEQDAFIKGLDKKEVVNIGGGEGEGEHVERVVHVHFPGHDLYIRYTGFYCSQEGTEWNSDFEQVFPRRIIATTYESADERGDKTDEA